MNVVRLIGGVAFMLGLFTAVFAGMPWYIYHDPLLPWWLKTAVYCIMGGILVVLLTVAIEHRGAVTKAREVPTEESPPGEARRAVLLQNTGEVPGRKVSEVLGLVTGHVIFAVSLGKDLSALMRLIPGGELPEYTDMMGHAREMAIERMALEAGELGADAVINIRFVTTSVVTGAAELLAYGTAVKLSNSDA